MIIRGFEQESLGTSRPVFGMEYLTLFRCGTSSKGD